MKKIYKNFILFVYIICLNTYIFPLDNCNLSPKSITNLNVSTPFTKIILKFYKQLSFSQKNIIALNNFFSSLSYDKNKQGSFKEYPSCVINFIHDNLNANENDSLLDIGSGADSFLLSLIHKKNKDKKLIYNAADIIPLYKTHLEDKPFINYITSPSANLPYKDESIDIIISSFSLIYFPDIIDSIKEMKRILKTNGKILLVLHYKNSPILKNFINILNQKSKLKNLFNKILNRTFHNLEVINLLFSGLGFEISLSKEIWDTDVSFSPIGYGVVLRKKQFASNLEEVSELWSQRHLSFFSTMKSNFYLYNSNSIIQTIHMQINEIIETIQENISESNFIVCFSALDKLIFLNEFIEKNYEFLNNQSLILILTSSINLITKQLTDPNIRLTNDEINAMKIIMISLEKNMNLPDIYEYINSYNLHNSKDSKKSA